MDADELVVYDRNACAVQPSVAGDEMKFPSAVRATALGAILLAHALGARCRGAQVDE